MRASLAPPPPYRSTGLTRLAPLARREAHSARWPDRDGRGWAEQVARVRSTLFALSRTVGSATAKLSGALGRGSGR